MRSSLNNNYHEKVQHNDNKIILHNNKNLSIMKTKFSFSAILFFLLVCLDIQTTTAQTLDWVRTTDSYTKYGTMIARDANDNVVSCGYMIHDRMFTRKWDKIRKLSMGKRIRFRDF